jgi:arabinogalactan oligomer/maltooligosaccharide transport system permease protein
MTAISAEKPRRRVIPFKLTRERGEGGRPLPLSKQLFFQAICMFIALSVLFPLLWVVSLALDPTDRLRPAGLIPTGATLDNFVEVIRQPTINQISFFDLAKNSFLLASSVAIISVLLGVAAAYAFSRLHFRFRTVLMLGILAVLMLPPVVSIVPLYIQLNQIEFGDFNLRQSLVGVGIAIISGLLPFAIWNLKGYLDTIPKDLEEAAAVDGATLNQAFRHIILPLSVPALAVTGFLGFVAGWTEYYFSVIFLTGDVPQYTLAIALNGMVGQYATQTPWAAFSAFAILFALPVSVVYLLLQKYIISGLTIGGVK